MGYTTTTKNDAIDALVGDAVWITPHDGDPGTTGANRVTAVDPEETTWGAASGGVKTGTQCAFPDAPAEHYTHYGAWNDEAMTDFRFGWELDPDITFGSPGTLYITPKVVFP